MQYHMTPALTLRVSDPTNDTKFSEFSTAHVPPSEPSEHVAASWKKLRSMMFNTANGKQPPVKYLTPF